MTKYQVIRTCTDEWCGCTNGESPENFDDFEEAASRAEEDWGPIQAAVYELMDDKWVEIPDWNYVDGKRIPVYA